MPSISLTLTNAGRLAALDLLTHCRPGSIVSLEWYEPDSEWRVGAFNKEKIPPSEVVTISEIPFVFQPKDSRRLDGKR
jgi:hypothetical protein